MAKYNGRKRAYRKKKQPTVKQVAARVGKLEADVETKMFPYMNVQACNAYPSASLLADLPQGLTTYTRVGDDINLQRLDMNIFITKAPAALESKYRVMLFWDLQTNGAFYSLLSSVGGSNNSVLEDSVITDPWICPHNPVTSARYKIIYDKLFHLSSDDMNIYKNINIKKSFNLRNLKIRYSSPANGVANIVSRSLNFVIYGNDNSPQKTGFQLYYKDA